MYTPDKATEIKGAITLVIATLTALWGWLGWAIIIWVGCVALDYVSGTAAARRAGEWSSAVARDGLWHKLGEIFAVLVAALCDVALKVIVTGSGLPLGIDLGPIITPVVLLWYIITELGSIVENAGRLGAPVPEWLKKSLKDYKTKLDADQGIVDEPVYTGGHDREHDTAPDNDNEDSDNDNEDSDNDNEDSDNGNADINNEKQTE